MLGVCITLRSAWTVRDRRRRLVNGEGGSNVYHSLGLCIADFIITSSTYTMWVVAYY